MAHKSLHLLTLLLIAASATGFTLRNKTRGQSSKSAPLHAAQEEALKYSDPEPLYEAIVYFDGRPTQILVDNIGDPEDLKFQTGDPVATPWPFIGAFGYFSFDDEGGFHYVIKCTASLIDSQTVLTAGHCMIRRDPGEEVVFVHGLSDVRLNSAKDYLANKNKLAEIESQTRHTGYDSSSLVNDIAIARLKKPLASSEATPICLGSTDNYNTNLMGAGWGFKNCRNASTETLRKAKATLVDQEECKKNYWDHLLDQMICTLFKTDNGEPAAAAPGDSGGPLFSLADPNNPVQVGIASFVKFLPESTPGEKCVRKDRPQVYARLTSFKKFIDDHSTNVKWC